MKAACTKVQYTSEAFAIADIERIKRNSKRDKVPQNAYLCSRCNFWHLTSQKIKSIKAIEPLTKCIEKLKLEIAEYKRTIADLKHKLNHPKQPSKEERKEINREMVVCELKKQNQKLIEDIARLRKEKSELINNYYSNLRTSPSPQQEQKQVEQGISGAHIDSRHD